MRRSRCKVFLLLQHLFMKRVSLTTTIDLVTPRAGSRVWLDTYHGPESGCDRVLPAARLSRRSMGGSGGSRYNEEQQYYFWPFERSWVAPKDQASGVAHNSQVTSVAVLPVEGDPEMRTRLATLLQQETTLRVEGGRSHRNRSAFGKSR